VNNADINKMESERMGAYFYQVCLTFPTKNLKYANESFESLSMESQCLKMALASLINSNHDDLSQFEIIDASQYNL